MVWAESAGGGAVDIDLLPLSSDASKLSTPKVGSFSGNASPASSVARAGVASPSSGKQTLPLSPAASGTDSAKTQSSAAPSIPKAVSSAASPQRTKSVEMSDVDTREVIQIFRSSAQAAKMTGLRRADIANACKDGGGQVEGRYFRFVYLNAKGGPTRTSLSTESVPSSSVNIKEQESGTKSKPLPALSSSPQVASAQDAGDDSDMGDEDDLVDVVGHGEAIKPRTPQNEEPSVRESNASAPMPVSSATEGDATPADATVSSEAKKTNSLDLVTLIHPLSSSSTRFKKYIELIDPKTDQVLVCFRGSNDAHDALGRKHDKKVILKACAVEKDHDSKKKDVSSALRKGKPYATVFGTFRMRYAPSDCPPTAYVFGAHEEDFRPFPEGMTHADIVKRWAEVYASERRAAELGIAVQVGTASAASSVSAAGGGGDVVDDHGGVASTSQVITIGGPAVPPRRRPQRYRTGPTSEEVLLRSVSLGPGGAGSHGAAHAQAAATAAFGGGRTLVTIRRPPPNEDDMACVVCQGAVARIVFEPCHHCVLCVSCSEEGHCRRFCPLCRAPIKGRIQPSFVRLIRPRIFSAHSFM
uniref:RING-type domain-containing protein n=1 Tax=Odontella aurita TaxID=265563 RepID=A0A7S4K6M5_9STRA|mmetsp:Transcript_62833/g.185562  ORF Transcript_62833/g.185562 Transcript_62833/m.185562 type:complete len:585 (+) Transcript_62833:723-2477(+)